MPVGVARRLFVLQLGAERVGKTLSVPGAGPGNYWEPLLAVVVETDVGWVLLDTGMSRAAFESERIAYTYGAAPDGRALDTTPWHLGPTPPASPGWSWILEGEPLITGLASVGLTCSDLALAAVSHLHVDHSGGIPTLTSAGVPVVIGADELAFARSGAVSEPEGFHPPDWTDPATDWRLVDADTEIAPGVAVLATPGHTPGHLSFAVRLAHSGLWIFCADAADLGQNLLDAVPCGSSTPDTAAARDQSVASAARLREFSRAGARVVPGHDPVIAAIIRHPDGGHR